MTMKRLQHRHSAGPALTHLALGILCMAALSCHSAGPTAAATEDESFFTHLHTEKAMANVTISPGRVGPIEITIQLETVDELPLTAKTVSVTLSNVQSGAGRQAIQAVRSSDELWHVRTSVPSSGRWTLGLGISISETDKVSIESPILIR